MKKWDPANTAVAAKNGCRCKLNSQGAHHLWLGSTVYTAGHVEKYRTALEIKRVGTDPSEVEAMWQIPHKNSRTAFISFTGWSRDGMAPWRQEKPRLHPRSVAGWWTIRLDLNITLILRPCATPPLAKVAAAVSSSSPPAHGPETTGRLWRGGHASYGAPRARLV